MCMAQIGWAVNGSLSPVGLCHCTSVSMGWVIHTEKAFIHILTGSPKEFPPSSTLHPLPLPFIACVPLL